MIITMPIIAVMLSSTPVTQRPMKTAPVDKSALAMMIDRQPEALVEEQQQDEFRDQRPRRIPRIMPCTACCCCWYCAASV